ncbi:MAG: Fe-S cluster assembly scaffold protein NifU [Methanomicrobiales archaeon]|nr:Fe-S cluster assembly scaffold protein NifU [Methanomicrobiales archaeon]
MYSEKVMDHFTNPRNLGEIEDPDGFGNVGNPVYEDIMKIFLKIENNRIVDAKFKTFDCRAAIASSSMATDLVKEKTLEEAWAVSNRTVAEVLDGLPTIKMHCSVLAEEWIHKAINDYRVKHGIPGRRAPLVTGMMWPVTGRTRKRWHERHGHPLTSDREGERTLSTSDTPHLGGRPGSTGPGFRVYRWYRMPRLSRSHQLCCWRGGKDTVVDRDCVERSDMNRQIVHLEEDIGVLKTESAVRKLVELNPDLDIGAMYEFISDSNIQDLSEGRN